MYVPKNIYFSANELTILAQKQKMTLHSFRLWLPFLECLRQKKVDTNIQTMPKLGRPSVAREAAMLNGLTRPSEYIINEVCCCKFDRENIQPLFDLVD